MTAVKLLVLMASWSIATIAFNLLVHDSLRSGLDHAYFGCGGMFTYWLVTVVGQRHR